MEHEEDGGWLRQGKGAPGEPPVFIRSSAIVPMQDPSDNSTLELLVTPGETTWSTLHDDGESLPPRYSRLRVSVDGLRARIGEWEGDHGDCPARIALMMPPVEFKDILINGSPAPRDLITVIPWGHGARLLRIMTSTNSEVMLL
jgi:hypothetical protein